MPKAYERMPRKQKEMIYSSASESEEGKIEICHQKIFVYQFFSDLPKTKQIKQKTYSSDSGSEGIILNHHKKTFISIKLSSRKQTNFEHQNIER